MQQSNQLNCLHANAFLLGYYVIISIIDNQILDGSNYITIVIRNGKIAWKHGPHVAEFWYWLRILGVAGATLHQVFSKKQAQVDLDAVRTIIDCFMC